MALAAVVVIVGCGGDEVTPEDRLRADALVRYAVFLAQQDNLDSAKIALETARELDPTNVEVLYRLGMIYEHTSDPAAAEHVYRSALAQDSLQSIVHYNLGQLYGKTERYDEAFGHFDAVLRMDTTRYIRSRTYYCIGLTYSAQNEAVRSADAYRQATEIDSQFGRAYVGWGQQLIRQERFEEAIPVLERAFAIDSARTETYNYLATAYRNLGRMSDALAAEQARARAIAAEKAREE